MWLDCETCNGRGTCPDGYWECGDCDGAGGFVFPDTDEN